MLTQLFLTSTLVLDRAHAPGRNAAHLHATTETDLLEIIARKNRRAMIRVQSV